jgi:uncharacterized membrane protein HdeD (DUF308 family)
MAQTLPAAMVRSGSTLSMLWGALLIVLGFLAIGAPFLAAVAVSGVVAWLLVLAGVVHIFTALHTHGAGSIVWKLLVGLAYLAFGGYMIMHPLLSVASLTIVLAGLFVIEGILNLVLYARMRSLHGSTWILFDGIITLLLGLMIYLQWPSSSLWAIGTLVGVSLMLSGFTRIGMTMAVRKALPATEGAKVAA